MKSLLYNTTFIFTLLVGIASTSIIGFAEIWTKQAVNQVIESKYVGEVQHTPVIADSSLNVENPEGLTDDWDSYFGTPRVWKFLLNDEYYGRLAVVRAEAETANGKVKSMLRLDCPGKGTYPGASIAIIVGDMEKSGFNLGNYSVSSSPPVLKKNQVEVRAVSPKGELSFKTKADGNIGYDNQYPTIIFFRLIKTKKLERLIAKGSTEVTFVIHDLEDYKKTIKVTFPEINSSSEMSKDLNGCRNF
jgi:hypothetical protein